jgi:hypothetical protein
MSSHVTSLTASVRFLGLLLPLFLGPAIQQAWAQGDVTPPTMLSFKVSPNPVNAIGSPQTVTVQIGASDNDAGVSFTEPQSVYNAVTFKSPSGKETIGVRGSTFRLISGTPLTGIWQSTFTVSNFSDSGIWTLTSVEFPDAVGNFQSYSATQLASLGIATTLTINSTPDTTPPALAGLVFSSTAVNVSEGPQTIALSFNLTDDLAGVAFPTGANDNFVFQIRSPSGKQSQWRAADDFRLISGTPLNGTWRITFPIPQYSEPGTWSINSLTLKDAANNSITLNAASISALGLSPSITVISTPSDTTPPTLLNFSFNPSTIDTTLSSQTVTVTIQASDNLSGVNWDGESPNFGFLRGATFTSPSGQQSHLVGSFDELVLTSGTPQNGTWTGTLVFPQFSEAGSWKPSLTMKDAATNTVAYSNAQLQTLGDTLDLNNILPSLQPDGSLGSAGGTVSDSVYGNRAQVTVPSGVLSAATSIAIDVLQTPLSVPIPNGYSTTPGFFVNVNTVPAAPVPLPPPGITVVLPLPTFITPGTSVSLWRVDASVGPVPEPWYGGGTLVTTTPAPGTVNSDGLSATYHNVAHLSLLVTLQPTSATVPGDVNGDGKVDCADVAIVESAFGTRVGQLGYQARADINGDGVVNIIDLAIVSRQLPVGLVCLPDPPDPGTNGLAAAPPQRHQ